MITVWCMNTNNHAPEKEVWLLRQQVKRHLSEPHEFVCVTEADINGIVTMKPINDLPGWWGKKNLFSPQVSRERNLWLDLDVVITGSLDGLVVPLDGSQLRIGFNWAQSGHGGCQSSLMYWEGDAARVIHDEFDPDIAYWPPRNEPGVLWGDQEWITALRNSNELSVEYFSETDMISYKYHCRDGLPEGAKVVVFHGKPDPHEVSDQWVKEARA